MIKEFLSPERARYYKLKRSELKQQADARRVVKQDALFIRYYGMSAYIELFPEAKDFGTNWHNEVLEELQRLEKRALANQMTGIFYAFAATKSKVSLRKFKKIVKDLLK